MCTVEKFVDISEVLQCSPSAKMAWRSDFTIVVFLLHSACLCSLSVASKGLTAVCWPRIPFSRASVHSVQLFGFVLCRTVAVMRRLHSANPGYDTMILLYSTATALRTIQCIHDLCKRDVLNCIPKRDGCLHTSAFLGEAIDKGQGILSMAGRTSHTLPTENTIYDLP